MNRCISTIVLLMILGGITYAQDDFLQEIKSLKMSSMNSKYNRYFTEAKIGARSIPKNERRTKRNAVQNIFKEKHTKFQKDFEDSFKGWKGMAKIQYSPKKYTEEVQKLTQISNTFRLQWEQRKKAFFQAEMPEVITPAKEKPKPPKQKERFRLIKDPVRRAFGSQAKSTDYFSKRMRMKYCKQAKAFYVSRVKKELRSTQIIVTYLKCVYAYEGQAVPRYLYVQEFGKDKVRIIVERQFQGKPMKAAFFLELKNDEKEIPIVVVTRK